MTGRRTTVRIAYGPLTREEMWQGVRRGEVDTSKWTVGDITFDEWLIRAAEKDAYAEAEERKVEP